MDDKIDSFLQKIKQIESSGGKNFNHEQMKAGMHTGHSAIGNYGLMPNTVKEIIARERSTGNDSPDFKHLEQLDAAQLKEFLESSPQLEHDLARSLAQHVLQKQPSEEMAAFSWNQGHNLSPEKIQAKEFQNHPYVQKFAKLSAAAPTKEGPLLASQSGAPLPTFANESGEIKDATGEEVLRKYIELLRAPEPNLPDELAGSKELADTFKDNLDDSMGAASMVGSIGTVKNLMQPAFGKNQKFVEGLMDKGTEVADDLGKDGMTKFSFPTGLKSEFKTQTKMPIHNMGDELPAPEALDPKFERLKALIAKKPSVFPARAPMAPIEKLPEAPNLPVTAIEELLKNKK